MTNITYRSDINVEHIQHWGTDETVARAARVSTGKDKLDQGKIVGLINYLVREQHTSTLEHCGLTLRFEAPLFIHAQFMTHRTLSKNTQSGRYTEFKPEFWTPADNRPLVNVGSSAHPEMAPAQPGQVILTKHEIELATEDAYESYTNMLNAGIANEVARAVLPTNTYTSWWASGNLLAWFNFLNRRNGENGHPQYEIVNLAHQVQDIIAEHYPITYMAWRKTKDK